MLDVITDSLKRGDSITFTGFGKFSTAHRAARMGVNPRNPSEKVQIQASTVPKFSAGSTLKQAVKSGGAMGGQWAARWAGETVKVAAEAAAT